MITVGDARRLLTRGLTGPYRSGVGDAASDASTLAYENSLDANGNAPGDPGYDASTSANALGTAQTLANFGTAAAPSAPSGIVAGTGTQAISPQASSTPNIASLVSTLAGLAPTISSIITKKPIAPKPAPAPVAAPWTTGEKIGAGAVVVGLLAALGYAATRGGRKSNPPFGGTKRKVGAGGWHHKRGVFSYNPRRKRGC